MIARTASSRARVAFCAHADVRRRGAADGPLAGLTFAVKDMIAIAGVSACFGNPTWLRSHPPASRNAASVAALLDAGAMLAGITVCDELALSLAGENHHYGTPPNPRRPDRVCGGSSSGSASAVAAGSVDFALGSDTAGSVRVPASHTGVFGARPTWGAVSLDGAIPVAPRFDTIGWLARDPETLARVGAVLLATGTSPVPARDASGPSHLVVVDVADGCLDPAAVDPFRDAARALASALSIPLAEGGVVVDRTWARSYATLQNAAIAATHRDFLRREQPAVAPLIGSRLARILEVRPEHVAASEAHRAQIVASLDAVLGEGGWLVLPSAAGVALPCGSDDAAVESFAVRGLALASVSSLGGYPEVSVPIASCDGCPLGVSIVGPRGSDRALLDAAVRIDGAGLGAATA